MNTLSHSMKKVLATITLALGLFVIGWAQSNFVVAGNGDLSIGQQFVTPAVGTLAKLRGGR